MDTPTWGEDINRRSDPQTEDMWHFEQERRSHDLIRIANPTDKDFTIIWGHPPKHFRVPANGTTDVDRYLAEAYWRDMTVQMINEMGDKFGEELLARVGREKPDVLLDKYLENKTVWDKVPHTNDEKLLRELTPKLWLGLVKKYGMDIPMQDPQYIDTDMRTQQEKILGAMEDKMVDEAPEAPIIESTPPLYVSKKDLAEEVLVDDKG